MKRYQFKIGLQGEGETMDEAWEDAVEGFIEDPGAPPINAKIVWEELSKNED